MSAISRSDKHHYVNYLGWVRSIANRKHHLDNQQSAARVHSAPAILQDRETQVLRSSHGWSNGILANRFL